MIFPQHYGIVAHLPASATVAGTTTSSLKVEYRCRANGFCGFIETAVDQALVRAGSVAVITLMASVKTAFTAAVGSRLTRRAVGMAGEYRNNALLVGLAMSLHFTAKIQAVLRDAGSSPELMMPDTVAYGVKRPSVANWIHCRMFVCRNNWRRGTSAYIGVPGDLAMVGSFFDAGHRILYRFRQFGVTQNMFWASATTADKVISGCYDNDAASVPQLPQP